jgi:hypothetical protein
MMQPVIIAVAITGSVPRKKDTPAGSPPAQPIAGCCLRRRGGPRRREDR